MHRTLNLKTKGELEIADITEEVKIFVREAKIQDGLINIQTLHTTATVFVNENEPLLWQDLKKHFNKLAPGENKYNHDDFSRRTVNLCDDECANGQSHCRAVNLPVNVCLNIIEGNLQLGQWQRILFIELDRPRERKVQLQILKI
jgi:secondary thiamine-phosphate synthase enzyme